MAAALAISSFSLVHFCHGDDIEVTMLKLSSNQPTARRSDLGMDEVDDIITRCVV